MMKERNLPRNGLKSIETELSEEDWLGIIEQLSREEVAPIFDEWRRPHHIKVAEGGRGAGAKSRSAGSLLVQFGERPQYFGDRVRVLCVRDVQKALKESSWQLISGTVSRLGYEGWEIRDNSIRNKKNGSEFVFDGLNNLTKDNLKSYEDFDILFVEEGAPIQKEAYLSIEATFRKKTAELWILFNRVLPRDPVWELYCENPDPSWSILHCRPGRLDNPWWDETNLQEQWDRLKETDPEEAIHMFEGLPRSIGERAIFSPSRALAMFDRPANLEGAEEIGCDIARFGKDDTVAFKRKGMQIIDRKKVHGFDTNEVAGMLWDMAGHNTRIPIKVDSGYNPGVIDVLKSWGANVVAIGFGEAAKENDVYSNVASEMYFTFPIDEVGIPNEYRTHTLLEDLTERMFLYDSRGRKRLESKDSNTSGSDTKGGFKARHGGRSPDEGDALVLTFYNRGNIVDDEIRAQMAALRSRN